MKKWMGLLLITAVLCLCCGAALAENGLKPGDSGDAVLELILTEYLFLRYPDRREGELTKIRSSLVCEEMLAVNSGNVELDNAAIVMTANLAMRLSDTPETFYPSIEISPQKAIDSLEQLREANLSQDFEVAKNYFASRTNAYEALLAFYALKNNPVGMLNTIESMKNRALQDVIGRSHVDDNTIKMVQGVLDEKKAMLITYFIGSRNLWIIRLDAKDVSIRRAENVQEIMQKIMQVLNACKAPVGSALVSGMIPRDEKVTMLKNLNALYPVLLQSEYEYFKKHSYKTFFIMPHNRLNY